jgi:hypothetical protein
VCSCCASIPIPELSFFLDPTHTAHLRVLSGCDNTTLLIQRPLMDAGPFIHPHRARSLPRTARCTAHPSSLWTGWCGPCVRRRGRKASRWGRCVRVRLHDGGCACVSESPAGCPWVCALLTSLVRVGECSVRRREFTLPALWAGVPRGHRYAMVGRGGARRFLGETGHNQVPHSRRRRCHHPHASEPGAPFGMPLFGLGVRVFSGTAVSPSTATLRRSRRLTRGVYVQPRRRLAATSIRL